MGLFDRFRKKKTIPTQPEPVTENATEQTENKPEEPTIRVRYHPEEERIRTFFEVNLSNTHVCKDKLKTIAVIHDRDGSAVSYDDAFKRYYINDHFFRWEFPVEKVTFEKEPDRFKVFGDGLYLGDIKYSKHNDDYRAISELLLCHGIDRIECKIKNRSSYFRVTTEEYNNTPWFNPETDDPRKKGTDKWFDENMPNINLKIYCDPKTLDIDYTPEDIYIPE